MHTSIEKIVLFHFKFSFFLRNASNYRLPKCYVTYCLLFKDKKEDILSTVNLILLYFKGVPLTFNNAIFPQFSMREIERERAIWEI